MRLSPLSSPLGSSYYVYNSAGELVRYTDADGRVTTYQYNPQKELSKRS
jgi:YD repeat-containing protein